MHLELFKTKDNYASRGICCLFPFLPLSDAAINILLCHLTYVIK